MVSQTTELAQLVMFQQKQHLFKNKFKYCLQLSSLQPFTNSITVQNRHALQQVSFPSAF